MKKLLNAYYKIDDCVEIAIKYLCALLLGQFATARRPWWPKACV